MHWLGIEGMPRWVATYDPQFTFWNQFASARRYVIERSRCCCSSCNVIMEHRNGKKSGANPWGARTLEWQIPSPPNYYNFKNIPTVYGLPYDFSQPLPYKGLDDELTDTPPVAAAGAHDSHGSCFGSGHRRTIRTKSSRISCTTRSATFGLQGFLLFLVSDCVLFSSFIFAYLYMRNSGQGWPPPGIHATGRARSPRVNSVVLFGSGATMHYALENCKHGNFMKYMWFLIATIVLGAGFLGGQGYEYTNLIYSEHVTWAEAASSARRSSR